MFRGLALAAAALMTSAAYAAEGEVAVFTSNNTDPFFQTIRDGADFSAEERGMATIQYVPTKPNNIVEQIAQVEGAVGREPELMIFVAIDPDALVPAIDKVNQAGIPIANIADKSYKGDFITYVGYDNFALGEIVATRMAEELGGSGKVIIIDGIKGNHTNEERLKGYKAGLAKFPDIEVLASQPANFNRLQALNVMENLLQANPQIDGVLTIVDTMGMGALDAIEGAGREGIIVASIDGIEEAVEAVRDGRMLATAEFSGFSMSCLAFDAYDRSKDGQEVPEDIILPTVLIDQANAEATLDGLRNPTCPTWDEKVGN
jgi:ribose transport system substrate-binding protein